ncbi:MAG: hypothetical protein H7329_12855 [Opitutaceae bacterium]|nr:hypothetical protein [Cytophagales bacterium]
MKKLISIAVLILVILVCSQLTISAHYCGGELVSLEFFKTKKGCGKCGSTEKQHDCCKNVVSSLTSADFNKTTIDFDICQSIVALPRVTFSFDFKNVDLIEHNKHSVQRIAPPILGKEPRFILFSSLIV